MADRPRPSALLTDLYELTMAAAYFENNIRATASFELFVRGLPRDRGYLVAAGLEQALDYLESLREFRFTGEAWAVPEGTPVFSEEPLLRVTAPIGEAQVVETVLLSTLTFQTMIATKAARVV